MLEVVYDLDKYEFRIFTFNRDIYKIILFKSEANILYVPLSIF